MTKVKLISSKPAPSKSKKKWKSVVEINGKKYTVLHGAKGYTVGKPGSKKQKSYCARSKGIQKKYGMTPKNEASRKKWKC